MSTRYPQIDVLDHGYVRLIEDWGCGDAQVQEAGIIEAARQSTQGSFRGWDRDKKLLEFLWNNDHATPFEFAGMVIEVQAPIFVFREWHRHRTQGYNEMSARYAPLPNMNWTPTVGRCIPQGENVGNRQAASAVQRVPTEDEVIDWLDQLESSYSLAERVYQNGLKIGIPKEVARAPMPVARYSRMRATTSLRNWLSFILLRSSPNAQQEIRHYSDVVFEQIIRERFPHTAEVFKKS